ncbi:MAG: bifunctional DNA-formamidopyrimidine glycosylase/DNA-(apurinic or apyrimidinic site) lyase [Acidimicrobiia bacterium]|nr:bifunctional DNA-formamidopyrimidine glycosylase/DNA-(apurinic or apyrimidinic site) lyase [Acidimicrobiia bacterium]
MPELPEVESTRLALVPDLEGKVITRVDVARDRMVRRQENPADFAARLSGRRIVRLWRHGKFLMADVGDFADDPEYIWVTHLGMSGRIQVATAEEHVVKHTNVLVELNDGTQFRFVDPRTFGFVAAWTPEELAATSIGRLGPDALTDLPRSSSLAAALAGRSAPIKALLLDQNVIAGVGNIYADESLHRAGISPHREGGSLTGDELKRLRRGIKQSLLAGLKWGGTSLDDLAYLLPDGRAGEYTARLRAYGREDERCRRCGGAIRRDVIRQRSSFWCAGCQD